MDLTVASAREYSHISTGHFTPAMAADYLREGRLEVRTLAGILQEFYKGDDLQERLIAAFLKDNPDAVPASVSKTVRNWLSGRNKPVNRKDIFHIAFALGLSEAQADYLLGYCTGCGIHYREGEDIVYSWFLRNGKSFTAAQAFYASLPEQPRTGKAERSFATGTQITQRLQQQFLMAPTEEALKECYLKNLDNFGELHLRAYHYFNRFLNQLIHPVTSWEEEKEEDYSIDAIMEKYLTMNMPTGKKRQHYNTVQKLIKANWPNATLLINIRLRKKDVPRKLLLLLYIVTENLMDDSYSEMDEEYITMQDRLEDHWFGLNAILADCGMQLLDPRNPFDWMVLYALAAEDEPMSERMEQVIDTLFKNRPGL